MSRQNRMPYLASWLGVAVLSLCAGPALALDDPGPFDRAQIQSVPAHLLPATLEASATPEETAPRDLAAPDPFRFASLGERLQALPLQPVVIGERPRLPYDPDPGLGLVFRIPLSL